MRDAREGVMLQIQYGDDDHRTGGHVEATSSVSDSDSDSDSGSTPNAASYAIVVKTCDNKARGPTMVDNTKLCAIGGARPRRRMRSRVLSAT